MRMRKAERSVSKQGQPQPQLHTTVLKWRSKTKKWCFCCCFRCRIFEISIKLFKTICTNFNTHIWHNTTYRLSHPQRLRSFWPKQRIVTNGLVLFFEHSQLIRFIRLDCEHAQNDGKSMNRRLPVLDLPRGCTSRCWTKGTQWTHM